MGIRDNCGTPLSIIVGGIPFRAHGDVDIAQMLSEWEVEALATSGSPMYKMTKTVSQAKSIDLAVNVDEMVLIAALAESRVDIPLGFVTPSGSTFLGAGRIKCEDHSHGNNKLPITMFFSSKPVKVG
jgi:hypothetical protein